MMRGSFKWDGERAYQEVLDAGWDGIRQATVFLWQQCQSAINTPSSRPYSEPTPPGNRVPGEPPRKRTGWFQANVLYTLDRAALTGRVGLGLGARYGLFLELGTRRMLARPWLLATLKKVWAQLQALAGRP